MRRKAPLVLVLAGALAGCAGSRTATWPGRTIDGNPVRSSREVATLGSDGRTLRLFLVRTPHELCLELLGVGGDCNPAGRFFASAPFEAIENGDVVAAVVEPAVTLVLFHAADATSTVPLTRAYGLLVACPGSCSGDRIEGRDAAGRRLFEFPA